MTVPKLLDIPTINDENGSISFYEISKELDFKAERLYYIYDVPSNVIRGNHAHKKLQQLIIVLNGSVDFILDNGTEEFKFTLSKPNQAIYLPAGIYRKLTFNTKETFCLVCASEQYSKEDYIFSYQDFLEWKKK